MTKQSETSPSTPPAAPVQQFFFKATKVDGTDFHSGTIDYAAALAGGVPVSVPVVKDPRCCTGDVLHASTVATETLVGGSWPCRLFRVSGVPVAQEGLKMGCFELTVVEELDPALALGPGAASVERIIAQARTITYDQARQLEAAGVAAWDAAWDAAGAAAWAAARDAARAAAGAADGAAARVAARDAAGAAAGAAARVAARAAAGAADGAAARAAAGAAAACIVRDLITEEQYRVLVGPWESIMGPIEGGGSK